MAKRANGQQPTVSGIFDNLTPEQIAAAKQVASAIAGQEVAVTEAELRDSASRLDRYRTYNLDELEIKEIPITWPERVAREVTDEDGSTRTEYRIVKRRTTLTDYVPMDVYTLALKLQPEMAKAETERRYELMQQIVLACWQLTDPEMTAEKLKFALDYPRTMAAFTFFLSLA